jgi:hypothetical protein
VSTVISQARHVTAFSLFSPEAFPNHLRFNDVGISDTYMCLGSLLSLESMFYGESKHTNAFFSPRGRSLIEWEAWAHS